MEISRLHFGGELFIHGDNGFGLFRYSVFSLFRMHPFAVLLQLILSLELFPTVCAQKLPMVGMAQQMHPQLIQRGEHLRTVLAGVFPLAVESPDVFAYDAVFLEDLLAVRAGEGVIVTMLWNVHLQLQDVVEALFADGTFKDLYPYEVSFYVACQSGIVQESLIASFAL